VLEFYCGKRELNAVEIYHQGSDSLGCRGNEELDDERRRESLQKVGSEVLNGIV
jgi:hypothetical protein